MSTKDIQIVRKLKASKGKMRQEAELAGAKASIPKQDVPGGVFIVTQVARVNGPAVFARVRRKSLRACKEERITAFTQLSGCEGKRQKRKGH